MTAPAAVRSTQEYDATFCGLWPETRFGPQPHREPRAVQSPSPPRTARGAMGGGRPYIPLLTRWLALPWTRDTHFMLEKALTLSAHCFLEKHTQDTTAQLAIRPLQRTTAADSGRPLSCEVSNPTATPLIANLATTYHSEGICMVPRAPRS